MSAREQELASKTYIILLCNPKIELGDRLLGESQRNLPRRKFEKHRTTNNFWALCESFLFVFLIYNSTIFPQIFSFFFYSLIVNGHDSSGAKTTSYFPASSSPKII